MRLQLDARALRLLRRLPRANVYSVLELLLLAVLAMQCARLIWTVVTPVDPLGDWRRPEAGYPGEAGAMLRGFDPFFRLAGSDAPQAVTPLQLTLFGTRIDEATGKGSAIIATPDQVQNSYSVGDAVMPGVTLKAVAFDHVTLDRGGSSEDLYIDQSQGAGTAGAAGAATTATPTDVADLRKGHLPSPVGFPPVSTVPHVVATSGVSLGDLRAGIGFIPRIDKGKLTGLVLRPQGSGAAFAAAGLKDGDVATAIDGQPVAPDSFDQASRKLKNGGILSLSVERGASVIPIGINVTGP